MTQQPRTPTTEPTTKAGDGLLTDIIQSHEAPSYRIIERVRQGILDIEAEARADLLAQIEKAVTDLEAKWIAQADDADAREWVDHSVMWRDKASAARTILAAIRSTAPVEPT